MTVFAHRHVVGPAIPRCEIDDVGLPAESDASVGHHQHEKDGGIEPDSGGEGRYREIDRHGEDPDPPAASATIVITVRLDQSAIRPQKGALRFEARPPARMKRPSRPPMPESC
jgi:hypothetical protein